MRDTHYVERHGPRTSPVAFVFLCLPCHELHDRIRAPSMAELQRSVEAAMAAFNAMRSQRTLLEETNAFIIAPLGTGTT